MQGKAALLVFFLLAPALAGCFNPFASKPANWDVQVKLTVVVTPRAVTGAEDVPLAVEMATRAFNASGAGVTYRIINDHAPDGIARAMDRLVKGRPTAFIAALALEEVQPALDRAAAAKIPLILVTPTNATPTGAANAYLLQAAADPAFAGRALARLAAQEGAPARIAVFTDDDAYTTRALDAFKAVAAGTIVREVHIANASTGVGALAKQACDARADVAVLLTTPTEAASLVRGIEEAGCRSTIEILAAPWARQKELIEGPGKRTDGRAIAEGVRGITPRGTEPDVFRSSFEAVYGRGPSRLAAAGHDAVAYATLAAFATKGGPGRDAHRGAITGADVRDLLATVAAPPGVKVEDIAIAATAAKSGDEIDWIGFEQDHEYDATHAPRTGVFDVWRVSASGGFDATGDTVDG